MVGRLVEQQQVGCATSARASSTRRRQPPDSVGTIASAGRSSRGSTIHADVDVPVLDMRMVFESFGHDVDAPDVRQAAHPGRDARCAGPVAPERARVRTPRRQHLQQGRFAGAVPADDDTRSPASICRLASSSSGRCRRPTNTVERNREGHAARRASRIAARNSSPTSSALRAPTPFTVEQRLE